MHQQVSDSVLYDKTLACLVAGMIGDAAGTPTESLEFQEIEKRFGWIDDFKEGGTDDTIMRNLLAEALKRTDGWATFDDWAQVWLDQSEMIFGSKKNKFFVSVLHTATKIMKYCIPREAALGNMPSSSSAMCISPVGIVNAGSPEMAAQQAYNIASLIHIHNVGYCQDGAAALAAAAAEAFNPNATPESIINTAVSSIVPISGQDMRKRILRLQDLAHKYNKYKEFRTAVYADRNKYFCSIDCDSRETVPLALALFTLADGRVEQSVLYGANFGRDTDTIAAMCASLAGILQGTAGIRNDWFEKAMELSAENLKDLAVMLTKTAIRKSNKLTQLLNGFRNIFEESVQ